MSSIVYSDSQRMTVRVAMEADRASVTALIKAYIDQFGVPYPDEDQLQAMVTALFEDPSRGVHLIAQYDGIDAGFVSLYAAWNTIRAQPFLYLSNLYVDSAHRRKGLGRALLQASRQYMEDHDYALLEWSVSGDNEAAVNLYASEQALVVPRVLYRMV